MGDASVTTLRQLDWSSARNVAVVGGGLAGLSAALELADAGCHVTLYEARPALGGAVQTLPEREGDPEPPPDNGQHIALGCFTEYLRFLRRIGEGGSYRRLSLALPVIGGDGREATIGRSPASVLRYGHLGVRDRLRVARAVRRLPQAGSETETFGALLRRLGCSDASIHRFWDVFIRPALNLRTDEVSARWGVFTVRTALLADRAASDVILPARPLGRMHGDAARRALEAAGATVLTSSRVESLDDLEAEAIVVATPPAEAASLLGVPDPELEHSPIVSVHLLFDRRILGHVLAALLESDAHWVFDRGALTGHEPPEGGQYVTVVSSGAPELMEIRGRELVDRIAAQLVERLGNAELLWSRVSREPHATLALRPRVARPGAPTDRASIVRAGSWTETGWPATMEGAVRSGVAAAHALASREVTA
ncbi:MAG TPA: hydroxysqualene dehydroxylase HpnE [Gaiellaceae bacterium]|nr:hydroxysqualene dehydroxylase HpnE [Gaiellaceae bacterium]